MRVLRSDVRGGFHRRVGNAVANKRRIRLGDVIDEVMDCLFKRFGGKRLTGESDNQNRRRQLAVSAARKRQKETHHFDDLIINR